MPIYEFKCECCKFEWEELRDQADTTRMMCPQCLYDRPHKKISVPGHPKFEGDGFYETDYRQRDPREKNYGR